MDFTAAELVAIKLSLRVAVVATLVSLPFGLAVAMLLARARFPGKTLVDGLVHLPLVLPPVVTGYLLLIGFGRRGPIGAFLEQTFGLVFAFRWTGAALASAVMGFPLMVRAVRLSIEAVDRRLEDAAASLGARRLVVFATVTFPLVIPGVLAGAMLAFARAMGEFGATITFVSNIPGETQTIPSAIYTALQIPGAEAAAIRLSFVSIVISLSALVLSEVLARRMRRRQAAP
jgi:molybdate transport system permease protein